MRLPSLRSKRLAPLWTLETSGQSEIIWKLLISPGGILAGEERDTDAKTGSLFAIDVEKGGILWRHLTLDEPWWFGSEKATNDTLFVQTFRKPDLPEPKGIIALDIRTGQTRWTEAELSFLFVEGDRVFAMRQGYSHRSYCALNSVTGNMVEDYGEDDSAVQEVRNRGAEPDPHSHYAERLGSGDKDRKAQSMLAKVIDMNDVRGPIDYLEFGHYRIYSVHVRAAGADAMLQNLLSNELIVLGKESSRPLFRETLHSKTPLPLPDNFFISHHTLIYVKEKRTLAGIRLR